MRRGYRLARPPNRRRAVKRALGEYNLAVVLNDNAKRVTPQVRATIHELVPERAIFYSRSLDDSKAIARKVVEAGYDAVFTGGGDGTVIQFINDLVATRAPLPDLGVLPLGTGNAIASMVSSGDYLHDLETYVLEKQVDYQLIGLIGYKRNQVYICNVIKCRPPENRDPMPGEIQACGRWLERQLELINPRVIVTLGNPATQNLLKTAVGITRMRGQWQKLDEMIADLAGTPVMPTFHPAYILRNYSEDTRRKVWSDLQAVMDLLGLTKPSASQ